MIKNSFLLLSISAAFFVQAQDVSTIRNTTEIYSNTNLNGSAKYQSMAGSIGALGGDVSALNVNPAGIGVAITGDISGTLAVQNSKNSTVLHSTKSNYSLSNVEMGNVAGVAVFELLTETPWKFLNIGVNYSSQSIEDYTETPGNSKIVIQKNLVDSSNNPVVGNLGFLGQAYDRYGNQSKMSFGIGGNYANNFYIGAGLNFHSAEIEQYDSAKLHLDLDNSVATYDKQYTPFNENSTGFSASLGIISKINNQFRLGGSIETPTWWTINRSFTEYGTNSSGYIGYGNYSEDRKLSTPLKATVSAALVPNKNFAINLDYTIGVTKPRYKVYGDAETELNSFFSSNSKNMSEIKLGAEYRVKRFRLRGGYAYASSPFDTMSIAAFNSTGQFSTNSYSNLFVASRSTLGLGIGLDFKGVYVDLGYQNVNSTYSNPSLYGNSTYGSGYYSTDFDVNSTTSVVSEVKNTKNNLYFTFGWKF